MWKRFSHDRQFIFSSFLRRQMSIQFCDDKLTTATQRKARIIRSIEEIFQCAIKWFLRFNNFCMPLPASFGLMHFIEHSTKICFLLRSFCVPSRRIICDSTDDTICKLFRHGEFTFEIHFVLLSSETSNLVEFSAFSYQLVIVP